MCLSDVAGSQDHARRDGLQLGGVRAAAFYTLVRTARLNGIEPEAWLTDVIARISSHPINRLADMLPWNWQPPATRSVAA